MRPTSIAILCLLLTLLASVATADVVVPSERVARLARDAGFDQVVTAENATDTAMLRALETWSS